MLVLSRKKSEDIVIYDPAYPDVHASISIVEIRGDKVRLGIMAPPNMLAFRREVYEAIQRDGSRATGTQAVGEGACAGESQAVTTLQGGAA